MLVYKLTGRGFESRCSHLNLINIAPISRKEFLELQAAIECVFTLKRARNMKRTYSLVIGSRKFYIRRNDNKVDSIETGRIVIAHLLP